MVEICIVGPPRRFPQPDPSWLPPLSNGERQTSTEIGQKLDRPALEEVASLVTSDTIVVWHARRMAKTYNSSPQRPSSGWPYVLGCPGVNATAGLPLLFEIMHLGGHLLH